MSFNVPVAVHPASGVFRICSVMLLTLRKAVGHCHVPNLMLTHKTFYHISAFFVSIMPPLFHIFAKSFS